MERTEAESAMSEANNSTLVKIEFRSAQSRHTLAKYIEKKQRNGITMPGPEGPTEFGFIPRAKVPSKATGFPVKKGPRVSNGAKEKAIADLMDGQKTKNAVDRSAIYKMPSQPQTKSSDAAPMNEENRQPSSGNFSYAANSDEEAEQIERVRRASAADARQLREQAATSRAQAAKKDAKATTTTALPKVVIDPPAASTTKVPARASTAATKVIPASSNLGASSRPMFQRNISNIVKEYSAFDVSQAIIMKPGEFNVKLHVDDREKGYKKYFSPEEATFGVLGLGDIIWVAERINPTGLPENDTIVLDAVVERKTLPDLVDSVKTGRYDQQKVRPSAVGIRQTFDGPMQMRMRKCGMTRLYYLIEDNDKAGAKGYEQMVWTVKSQTQVIDGFVCNILANVSEAVKHLKRMTKVMTEVYEVSPTIRHSAFFHIRRYSQHKTLYGIPSYATSRGNYLKQLDILRVERRGSDFLPTLRTWNALNGKHHNIGLNWAQMVLSHNGVSAEKACAIVDRWPTTAAFITDVSKRKRQEEADGEVAGKKAKAGSAGAYIMEQVSQGGKRDLGQALSQQLYDIWTQKEY